MKALYLLFFFFIVAGANAQDETIYPLNRVSEAPVMNGCTSANPLDYYRCSRGNLREFVRSRIEYPDSLLKAKIGGWVEVSFVVTSKGEIADVKALDASHEAFRDEVVYAVRSHKGWIAAKRKGEPVSCRMEMVIDISPEFHRYIAGDLRGPSTPRAPRTPPPPVVQFPDEMPSWGECKSLANTERNICSNEKLMEYIAKEIKYPKTAIEAGIQGRVYVRFTVTNTGKITDINVMRGIGGGCDEEAIRVIKSMPTWTPGTVRGQPVNSQMTIPMKFALE